MNPRSSPVAGSATHHWREWHPAWPCPAGAILSQQRHGAGDPSWARVGAALWRAWRTPIGPATLRVEQRGRVVRLDAWGPGAAWCLEAAPGMLGGLDDPSGFTIHHPFVAELTRRFPHFRFSRSTLLLDALVPAIIEQKVTGQEAFAGYAELLRRHGTPAPLPQSASVVPSLARLRVPPEPDRLRAIPSWEWIQLGIGPERSRTLVRVAQRADALVRAEARAVDVVPALTSLPGVGVWTAAETVRRVRGDADAVSFGDFHIATNVTWALSGERADDQRMAELLEPYRPHRARVVALLEHAGVAAPRRGPRMSPRRHLPRR